MRNFRASPKLPTALNIALEDDDDRHSHRITHDNERRTFRQNRSPSLCFRPPGSPAPWLRRCRIRQDSALLDSASPGTSEVSDMKDQDQL